MNETITIDQTLHGYSNGHRLLASSTEFASADERALLMMSDLSGPRVVEGFREYLTGYPLPSGLFYALARTWYAEEMERSGCVWTHTLLIPADKVAALKDAASLRSVFRRPGTIKASAYSQALHIAQSGPNQTYNSGLYYESFVNEDALNIMTQLYLEPDTPAGIAAKSGNQFEILALLIWSQQWPKLRMNFGFCTGALSERVVGHRPLDLQFGPYRKSRPLRFEGNIHWLRYILEDLPSKDGTDFRGFIWHVSGDLRTRADFAKLAEVYHVTKTGSRTASILATARAYPEPSDATTLKQFAVRYGADPTQESEILLALATKGQSFDIRVVELQSRASELYTHNPLHALQLLLQLLAAPATPFRNQLAKSIVRSLTASDFNYLSRTNLDSFTKLACIVPELPENSAFWLTDISLSEKVDVLKALQEQKCVHMGNTIQALLRSGNHIAAGIAFNTPATPLDSESLGAILTWASESEANSWILTRPEWSKLLSEHDTVMRWFSLQERIPLHMLSLLAQIVDPLSAASGLGMKTLSAAANIAEPFYKERDDIAAFMFVAAGTSSDERAPQIAVTAFVPLHELLYYSRLSYRAWQLLQRDSPSTGADQWDQCDRLRRALSLAFVRHNWPPNHLWRLISHDDELSYYMLRTAREFQPAYRLLKSAWITVGRTDQSISTKQSKQLRKLFSH